MHLSFAIRIAINRLGVRVGHLVHAGMHLSFAIRPWVAKGDYPDGRPAFKERESPR